MQLSPIPVEKFDQGVRLKQRNNGKWYLFTPPKPGEVEEGRIAVTVYLGLPPSAPVTQEQARDAARSMAGERARGIITTSSQVKITVTEVIALYKKELERIEHESLKTITCNLKWLDARLGALRVAQLTTPMLHHLVGQWQKKPTKTSRQRDGRLASSTIKFRCGWLRSALRHAVMLGVIQTHQVPLLPKFPRREKRQNFLEPEEFYGRVGADADGVLAQYATSAFPRPQRAREYAVATEWGYECGWRSREVRFLEWEWVAGGEIRLPDWICKNRRGRKVPLIAALAAVIDRRRLSRAYVDRQGVVQRSKYVFHHQGKRLQEDTLNEFFRRAIQAAPAARDEVRHFYFHDLRRSAVRNLIRAGVDRKVAKTIAGFLSDKIFDDYNITSGKDQQHALVRSAKYTRGRRLYGEDYDEDNPQHVVPDSRPDNRVGRVRQEAEN